MHSYICGFRMCLHVHLPLEFAACVVVCLHVCLSASLSAGMCMCLCAYMYAHDRMFAYIMLVCHVDDGP